MNDLSLSIRKGRKYDQVVSGAREVFLRDGFSGASVDDIARASGVSKATLYSYFPDKQSMFMEVARNECLRMADDTEQSIDMTRPVADVLTQAAESFVRYLVSDFSQAVFRICVAESDRFPELGRAFYEAGPKLGQDRMMAYFAAAQARGELRITDPEMAADQFSELCKATLWPQAVFGIRSRFPDAEIRHVAKEAVLTFLARYGA